MARLACIIPVLGTTDGLETTLVSVLERRPDDCDVIVVLNVPYDDPYQLSGEVKFLEAPRRAGLVQCLNLGIGATRAPLIHTLAAGFEVSGGWLERARARFEDPRVALVAPAIHHAADRDRVIATGVGYGRGGTKTIATDEQSAVGPLLEAAFIRRDALSAFNGILPTTVGDDLADIDLALTLHRAGWQSRIDTSCQVFAPAIASVRTGGFAAGVHAERFFWRHWSETGRLAGLAFHPFAAVGAIVGSGLSAPLHALGRFVALCQLGSQRGYQRTLAAATSAADQAAAEWQWQLESNRVPTSTQSQSLRIDQPHPVGRRKEAEPTRRSSHSVDR